MYFCRLAVSSHSRTGPLVTRPPNLRQPSVTLNQDIAGDAARIVPRPAPFAPSMVSSDSPSCDPAKGVADAQNL